MHTKEQSDDFVASFSLQRQRLLLHASSLLGDGAAGNEADAVPKLSQALAASLEVLKVAEEELIDARRRQVTEETVQQRRLAHLQMLFDLAPTPLVLTTADTSVRETNRAAAALLGRDPYRLEGRQLSAMIPRDQQAAFREQLAHVVKIGRVASWSFVIERHGDVPCGVTAAVELVDDAGVGARALYWNIRQSPV